MIDLTMLDRVNITKIYAPMKYRLDKLNPDNIEEISFGIKRLVQIVAIKMINKGHSNLSGVSGDEFETIAYHIVELVKSDILEEQDASDYNYSDDEYLIDLYISSVDSSSRGILVEIVVKDQKYAFNVSFGDRS